MNKILFYFPWREVSGGPVYLSRLANMLSKRPNYEVYYADYADGYAIEKLSDNVNKIIVSENDFSVHIYDSLTVITPIYFASWLPKLSDDSKVLFLNWHISSIPVLQQNSNLSDDELLNYLNLLAAKNACFYLDKSHYLEQRKYCDASSLAYVPILYSNSSTSSLKDIIAEDEYNIGVLSRLVIDKIFGIYNLIDNFKKIKSSKKKRLHVIGDGEYYSQLLKYNRGDIELICYGTVVNADLENIIKNNIDVMFTMGTSVLDSGSYGVPSVIIPHNMKRITTDKYVWLYETVDFCLGWYETQIDELQLSTHTLEEILLEVYTNGNKVAEGKKCREYVSMYHAESLVFNNLEKSLQSVELSVVENNKFLSTINLDGHKSRISILGIDIVSTKYRSDILEQNVYLFGVPLLIARKINNKRKFSIYFLDAIKRKFRNKIQAYVDYFSIKSSAYTIVQNTINQINKNILTYGEISNRLVLYSRLNGQLVQMDTCDTIVSSDDLYKIATVDVAVYEQLIEGLDLQSVRLLNRIIDRVSRFVNEGSGHFAEMPWEADEYATIMIMHNENIMHLGRDLFMWSNYVFPKKYFATSVVCFKCYVPELINLHKIRNRSIIDAGAYMGDSSLVLSEFTDQCVYAFEPNLQNFDLLKTTIKLNKNDKIIPVNSALGARVDSVSIAGDGDSSKVSLDLSTSTVSQTTIDEFSRSNSLAIGLIKMDIEGYERFAIEGAKEVLKKYKPSLLISIYHNYDDLFYMKKKISDLNLGYSFKVRKPSDRSLLTDTILICEVN